MTASQLAPHSYEPIYNLALLAWEQPESPFPSHLPHSRRYKMGEFQAYVDEAASKGEFDELDT